MMEDQTMRHPMYTDAEQVQLLKVAKDETAQLRTALTDALLALEPMERAVNSREAGYLFVPLLDWLTPHDVEVAAECAQRIRPLVEGTTP